MYSLTRRPGEVFRMYLPPSHAPREILVGIQNVSRDLVKLCVQGAETDVQIARPALPPTRMKE